MTAAGPSTDLSNQTFGDVSVPAFYLFIPGEICASIVVCKVVLDGWLSFSFDLCFYSERLVMNSTACQNYPLARVCIWVTVVSLTRFTFLFNLLHNFFYSLCQKNLFRWMIPLQSQHALRCPHSPQSPYIFQKCERTKTQSIMSCSDVGLCFLLCVYFHLCVMSPLKFLCLDVALS